MCGLCGLIGEAPDWTDALLSTLPKRQERLRRIKILNVLVAPKRLKISDFHGTNYMVQTPTGGSSMVNGFSELLLEIETMSKTKLDVLSPEVLSYLEQMR